MAISGRIMATQHKKKPVVKVCIINVQIAAR
jgi:hypothetical protein